MYIIAGIILIFSAVNLVWRVEDRRLAIPKPFKKPLVPRGGWSVLLALNFY